MQPGSLNASMLLAQVLESEHGKLGNRIAKSDFAGELKKLLSQKDQKADSAETSESGTAKLDPSAIPEALKATVAAQQQTSDQASEAVRQCRSSSSSSDPGEKIKTLNNRTKNSKSLYITNPVLIESTLAKLHYPADTIKAAESLRNRDGWISLKDFKDLLQKRHSAQTEAATQGERIPAAEARAIVAAIAIKHSGSGQGSSRSLKSSLAGQVVGSGKESYTTDEFGGLLETILEKADGTEAGQQQGNSASGGLHDRVSEKEETRISAQVDVAPRQGQAESLTATMLPSFISDKPQGKGQGKTQTATAGKPSARSEKVSPDTPENVQVPAASNRSASTKEVSTGGDGGATTAGASPAQTEIAENLPENFGRAGDRDRFHPDTANLRDAAQQAQNPGAGEAKNLVPPVSDTLASAEGTSRITDNTTGSAASEQLAREAASSFQQLRVTQTSVSRPAAQEKPALHGQDVAAVAKEMEKNLKATEPVADAAVLHAGSTHFQGSRIEMSQMQQTPGDGLSYYDPARSAEMVQYYREHSAGTGGQQLVLEMEPSEFGKMSIKIDAKKDEVSAVVLTASEPARHALLRHSPELRQNFQDQGMTLGKFEVNVNRENPGGGNSPESQKQQAPGIPSIRKASGTTGTAGTAPVYTRTDGILSQVSIFA